MSLNTLNLLRITKKICAEQQQLEESENKNDH